MLSVQPLQKDWTKLFKLFKITKNSPIFSYPLETNGIRDNLNWGIIHCVIVWESFSAKRVPVKCYLW